MVLHVGADLVGRAIDAAADAGACEQCGKACRPMVTAVHAIRAGDFWCAAKFPDHDHQGGLQQAALVEILSRAESASSSRGSAQPRPYDPVQRYSPGPSGRRACPR